MLQLFAIRDARSELFTAPMVFQARGQAIRSFSDAVNASDGDFAKHPDDYTLFFVGTWDDAQGRLVPASSPEPVALGSTLLTSVRPV